MADLRIVDAPEILLQDVEDGLKLPTGGFGNYAITMSTISDWLVRYKDLALKSYVDSELYKKADKVYVDNEIGRLGTASQYNFEDLPISVAQKQTNENIYESLNVFTKRNYGYISVTEFIPEEYQDLLKDFTSSMNNVGDVSTYISEAFNYARENQKDILVPFGYYFINKTIRPPKECRLVGMGMPYFVALKTMTDVAMLSTDNEGQDQYYIDGFRLNGEGVNTPNLEGLRVGGCRNSTFKNIVVTSCPQGAVVVYPTHPNSGDVENIELDHIWSVRGQGVVFKTNSDIARGNITDGTITNCQLTSGDASNKDGFPLLLASSPDKMIFGLKFDRIFTKTTDETHIFINPNGGSIYGNDFSFFTGESWTISSGGMDSKFSQSTLYVMDGMFENNNFSSFYKTGLQGNGIYLGNGSKTNTFDTISVFDRSPETDNSWFTFDVGADKNEVNNIKINNSIFIEDGATASNNLYTSKIVNRGQNNLINGVNITTTPDVLVKRDDIFKISGNQLANYPVNGCTFAVSGRDILVTIPSGGTQYFLDIPFETTANFKGDRVGVLINYQFDEDRSGLVMATHLCGQGKEILDYTIGRDNVMSFISVLDSSNKKLVISFLGNRTKDVKFKLKDIVISQGSNIPYFYNYSKNYVEN